MQNKPDKNEAAEETAISGIAARFRSDLASLDRRVLFALVYAAAGLTAINFLKEPSVLEWLTRGTPLSEIGREAVDPRHTNLANLSWWVFVSVTFYSVVPALWVRFVQKRPLREIGLALNLEPGFLKLLAFCLAVMLPVTYLMSLTAGFAAKYPFLKVFDGTPYLSAALLIWELIYFAQFFGLEFFFRGFLVHSLKPTLGAYSILAMTVPYTMIHFQKPMPEAFAAIFAGLFLGWISYRNGTIWLGLVLHCSVAFSMDIFSLYNAGLIFR
ncbi:MAG: CAAX amino terminal protease self- immunity [Acidobacteria bacterium OLB17]|nr:MAG: CAAX amino terminal protease self- immunity [Acidobacteria bacterium OLB17]MCZ2391679.1 CPBP family intramembrane metalloprotease [Acidobacteriota bacterium]